MNYLKLLLCVLLIFLISSKAQSKLKGNVFDAETGEALIGANIFIENIEKGTTTNEKGYFEITGLEAEKYVITISFIGYETQRTILYLVSDIEKFLNFNLYKKIIETEQIVITATKSEQTIGNVIGRLELINERNIRATPVQTIDDLFKNVSGVNVDRANGIFSQANVNIRGITGGEQGRILALLDGMAINKTDGGTVNWNRVLPQDIERIEIFKGPGSSVYGNNAMGGVINFITKKQKKAGYNVLAKTNYGTFNTFEQNISLSGKIDDKKGLNFRISGFNRNSDGYNSTREEYRDIYSSKAFLNEIGLNAKLGYDLNEKINLVANYNFYDDKRGYGTKVKEDNYMKHKTNYASFGLNAEISKIRINISAFAQQENYRRVMEKYKIDSKNPGKLSSYDLIYVDADRSDLGAALNISFNYGKNNFTLGAEYKKGQINGSDVYQTSSDVITNTGDMNTISVFLQDELSLSDNFKVFAGLRGDIVKFTNGNFILKDPTKASEIFADFAGKLKDYDWTAITPKLSMQYKFTDNFNTYLGYSQGFRAATLDDMTRMGFIKLGLKLANPELKPETVDNFELGFNFDYNKELFIMPSFYYMIGNDFMYYLWTGEMSGSRRIIKKSNITKVHIYGGDLDIKYFVTPYLNLFANVSYTNSEIKSFTGGDQYVGKKLTYTPDVTANFGISYLNEYVNTSVNVHYQGKQFTTDDNIEVDSKGISTMINSYYTVDLRIWQKLFRLVTINFDIQNILDKKELSTYDRIAPGRIISAGLSVEL